MKSLLTGVVALGLIAPPAIAAPQTAPPEVIHLVAYGCRTDRMFTIDAAQPYEGVRMRQLGPAAAPLNSMEVIATSRSKTLVGVDLWAYQPDDAGTAEERRAFATRLLETFDAAIVQAGLFTERAWDEDKEAFVYSAPAADPVSRLTLELTQMGVSVIAGCADESRRQLAMDEYLGRTRIQRPVKPRFPAPERVALAECDDPVRAEKIYDAFEAGGGYDVLNLVRASNEYFEHLTQWYGQVLMDKGAWTQARNDAFHLTFLQDRVIMTGLEQQMGRLEPLMTLPIEVAEAREAADPVGSCRAVVRLIDLVAEIGASNETQWNRATTLYRAEADRLGVALED